MPAPQYQETNEIVVAATLWLMHRYQQTGCKKLAHMVELHLRWIRMSDCSPALTQTCQRLSLTWQTLSGAALSIPPSTPH
jgi:hypothetical protein